MAVRALLLTLPLLVAQAPAHDLNVTPLTPKPGDTFTVSGLTDCPDSPYTVTFTYRDTEEQPATLTLSGTTDAEGEYVQPVTVPELSTAWSPATVSSVVTSCAEGDPVPSETVEMALESHQGELTVTPVEGPAGTVVTLTGTDCWGDVVKPAFGQPDEFEYAVPVTDKTLAEDRTWTATFTIPDDTPGPGRYAFFAGCPGTFYEQAGFRVLATVVPPVTPPVAPPAPPAAPVPTQPSFTG